jgi:adenylate kinase family enzyme
VHRSDDNEESLRERLKQYHSNVEAIKKFYDDIKITVDGAGPASASFKDNVARVQKEIFKGIDDLKYGPGSSSRH